MKNIYIIIIGILLISFVVAGVTGVWNREIDIDNEKLAKILEHTSEDTINISTSEVICDNEFCSSKIYQKDVIQTEFRILREYCSKYSVCKEEECEVICLEYKDYTEEELKIKLDDYIKLRLETYADALTKRDSKGDKVKVVDGGNVKIK